MRTNVTQQTMETADFQWHLLEPKIRPILDKIEPTRKKYFLLMVLFSFLTAILLTPFIGMLFIFGFSDPFFGLKLMLCYMFSVCLCFIPWYDNYFTKLREFYKSEILPKLVEAICKDAYCGYAGKTINAIENSELFNYHDWMDVEREDDINGFIGRTKFSFCEMVYRKVKSNGKLSSVWFRGIAFYADFNKYFQGQTVVSSLGRFFQMNRNIKWNKKVLDSVKFNRTFKVFSTDIQAAYYILSPSLQERLISMVKSQRKTMGDDDVVVSFNHNEMLILIPTLKNRFEPRLIRKMTMKKVQDDFSTIRHLIGIVEELNLNTRIWTKE